MDTKIKKDKYSDVNDTAFWMAGCRAELVELSKDVYASLWLNQASRDKHRDYTEKVSSTENIALSLRNRFFLEKISKYLNKNPEAVFVNIGAGFSSYPFLMNENGLYFEADCADNIRKKQKKIKDLQKNNLLPKRKIKFCPVDLNNLTNIESLFKTIKKYANNKKTFILFEGLIYYLSAKSTEKLFQLTAEIQTIGSQAGIVSWDPGTFDLPVYKRFKEYFTQSGKKQPIFTCHDPNLFEKISGYQLIEQTGYENLSKKFMKRILKPKDDVFWETITIIEKTL